MRNSAKFNMAFAVHHYSVETPNALALAAEGIELTYSELAGRAKSLAMLLQQSPAWQQQNGQQPRVAVLASRSVDACVAVLGISWAGATYVPISLKLPEERLISILSEHQFSALVTDVQGAKLLTHRVLAACPVLVITPHAEHYLTMKTVVDTRIYDLHDLPKIVNEVPPAAVKCTDRAYIIFTSGTTGTPKGVVISCEAIFHYVKHIADYLSLRASDRVLGIIDWSNDPSIHNMFATWHVGASLHLLPAYWNMNAVKFVRDTHLTVWVSVPSLVGIMKQIKVISPNALRCLRLTVFGGEQLTVNTVETWQAVAPNSAIVNLYGPTEVTVSCLGYWIKPSAALDIARDIVPIGHCLSGCDAAIMRKNGTFAELEEPGELVLFGKQLAEGYLDEPDLTAAKFPIINHRRGYLTGDLAVCDANGSFHHLGRMDNQVKVLGHRVELEEIETHLRVVSGSEQVVTVAWPIVNGSAQGIVAFIDYFSVSQQDLLQKLKARLPFYMIPAKIIAVGDIPLNPSGKIDRRALLKSLH